MALSKNFELGNFASGLDVNNSTGAITNINLNTDGISEGSNLYYTDARVNTFAGGGSLATITTSGDVTVGGNLIVNGSSYPTRSLQGAEAISDGWGSGNSYHTFALTDVIDVAQNDYLETVIGRSSSSDWNGNIYDDNGSGHTVFYGYLVG